MTMQNIIWFKQVHFFYTYHLTNLILQLDFTIIAPNWKWVLLAAGEQFINLDLNLS